MNIVVCIKQVPASSNVAVDPDTGTLIRDSAAAKMNPFDLFALECALRLKETHNAHITALTMGPPQSEKILKEAFMMDVDEALLLTDRAFAGADVLATSYALSQAIRHLDTPDLIICGKQTTDGDTAQVGPAIGEFLGLPHVAWVSEIVELTETHITVYQEQSDKHKLLLKIPLPCLITVEKDICMVRLPSYKTGLKNKAKRVQVLNLSHMPDKDAKNYGLDGSATQVERIFPPDDSKDKVLLDGNDENVGNILVEMLDKANLL